MAQVQNVSDNSYDEVIVGDLKVGGNLTVDGTLSPGAAATYAGDVTVSKASPILEVDASTDTKASIVIDGGTAAGAAVADSVLVLERNNVAKWAIGRDNSNTDALVIARSGVLETNPVLTVTQSNGDVSLAGNVSFAGAQTFGTGTGAVSLNGDTTIAGAKTFATGTGAVTLAGDTTISGAKTLTTGTGAVTLKGNTSLDTAKTLTITDDGAGLVLGATVVAATGAEINRACDVSARKVNVTTTPITITEAVHEGKIITVNMAGGAAVAFTLPVATGGCGVYRFIIGTSQAAGSLTITRAGADVMNGFALGIDDDAVPATGKNWLAGASSVITLNGTTQGGRAGDRVDLVDYAPGLWQVTAILKQTGAEATPFS